MKSLRSYRFINLYLPVMLEQTLSTVSTMLGTMLVSGLGTAVSAGVGMVDQINFVFMNVLTYLDKPFKEKLIRYLKLANKRIINYTTEIEETLFLDYITVIYDNKVIMEGLKEQVLQEEKILKKLGFHLPFIVELSNGLKYYGLVDKIYFKNEELVNALWK